MSFFFNCPRYNSDILRGFNFADGQIFDFSRGFNFAKHPQICEIRENLSAQKLIHVRYDNSPSTKDIAHRRRSKGKGGTVVHFQAESVLNMTKDEFLIYFDNRQRVLRMLISKMNLNNLHAIRYSGDADVPIVKFTIEAARLTPKVVIGNDTDILILLIHAVEISDNLVFFTSNDKTKPTLKVWDMKYTQKMLGVEICNAILPRHAFLGYDITPRLFSTGKQVTLKKFRKSEMILL